MKIVRQPIAIGSASFDDKTFTQKTLPTESPGFWEEFLAGDSSALSALYRYHVRELYNYGRQFTEHATVQDCIQEVFYDLIRKRESLRSVHSVKAYLFACMRHRMLKQHKKSEKRGEVDLIRLRGCFGIEMAETPFEDNEICIIEDYEKLNRACSRLTERQREAVLLFYYEKLSYKELTEVLQLGKIHSARMLMHRAIQSLRKILRSTPGS